MQVNQTKTLTLEQLNNFIKANKICDIDKKALITIFEKYDVIDGIQDNTLNEENTQIFIKMMKMMFSKLKDKIDTITSEQPLEEAKPKEDTTDTDRINTDNFISELQVNEEVKNALKSDPSFVQLVADYNARQKDLEQAQNTPMGIGTPIQELRAQTAKRYVDKYINVIQNWKDGVKGELFGYNNITTSETVTLENGQKAYKCDDGHFYAPSTLNPALPDERKPIK